MHLQEIRIWNVSRNWSVSHKEIFPPIKEWELEKYESVSEQIETTYGRIEAYKLVFLTVSRHPKLGKEFDLLQIKDDQIVNIELKAAAYRTRPSGHKAIHPVLSGLLRETDPVVYLSAVKTVW